MNRLTDEKLTRIEKAENIRDLLECIHDPGYQADAFSYRIANGEEIVSISRDRFYNDCIQACCYLENVKDEKIAVLGENSYAWVVAFFSISCCGKQAVLLDKGAGKEDCKQMLKKVGCQVVICSENLTDHIAYFNSDDDITLMTMPEFLENIRQQNNDHLISRPDGNAVAAILFTSGTTGKRKAVPLTHHNFAIQVIANCKVIYGEGKIVCILPLFHVYGIIAALFLPLMDGCTVFFNDSIRNLVQDMRYCKPMLISAVPAVIEMAAKLTHANKNPENLRKFYGPDFQIIVSGGGPLHPATRMLYQQAGILVFEGYGMTECTSTVAFNTKPDLYHDSVGIPLWGCEYKISEEGEILVRGETIMNGYYDDSEENEKSFTDGWYKTGDLGRIGEKGELYLTGRIKKLIILSNGDNIPSEPIEALISALPYVREVVVRGINDVITAEVFPYAEAGDVSEILRRDIEGINRKLPLNQCIGKILIRDHEFRKTTTNKIIIE